MIILSRVSAKVFFGAFFFARKREKKLGGIFLVFFFVFFGGLGVFVFVFRALARKKFGFIFCDEPSKAGNFCPAKKRNFRPIERAQASGSVVRCRLGRPYPE